MAVQTFILSILAPFMLSLDGPPPIYNELAAAIDKINELEADIERLENRLDELEEHTKGTDLENDKSDKVRKKEEIIDVEATFYTARCDGCSGITKTGYDVRRTIYSDSGRRIIAVDPSVIPLRSIVAVKLANGDEFEAEALDIGGAIKGARIDVLVPTRKEAYRLGRQSAEVEIISEGRR